MWNSSSNFKVTTLRVEYKYKFHVKGILFWSALCCRQDDVKLTQAHADRLLGGYPISCLETPAPSG